MLAGRVDRAVSSVRETFRRLTRPPSPHGFISAAYAIPNGTEPTIFIDAKNGVYMNSGASVAVTTLLTENTDWGTWDPATMITPGQGIKRVAATNPSPILTGDAFDLVSAGATIVIEFVVTGTSSTVRMRYEMTDDLNDFNTYYGSSFANENVSSSAGAIYDNSTQVDDGKLANGTHKTAFTMIDGQIVRSTDGAAVVDINPADPWTPPPAIMGFVLGLDFIIETIGIYPAQPDADLPMLSAL